MGYFDIETTNLKANYGFMLSYCIKPADGGPIIGRIITKKELMSDTLDKGLVEECIADMKKFSRVMTHYGTNFDIKFVRTRALKWGIQFPKIGELYHTDVYYMAKRLLCLHSMRQGAIAETLQGDDIKTRINPGIWQSAMQGRKHALDYIWDHNKKDVAQLEGNYLRLREFTRNIKKSV